MGALGVHLPTHYYLNYLRLLDKGPNNFVRGRKKSTIDNLALWRIAEQKLSNGEYTWKKLLEVFSHTTKKLSERLEEQFNENRELLLQDVEIEQENYDQFVCGVCNLQIWERFMITPCGDTNVCNQYITMEYVHQIKGRARSNIVNITQYGP